MKTKLSSVAFLAFFATLQALGQAAAAAGPNLTKSRPGTLDQPAPIAGTNSATDGLAWLVGRWRCITRQYVTPRAAPLGGPGEDALEYFNVYLPYADDHLTTTLTNDPNDRPISAEFLVRSIAWPGPFAERLVPMPQRGPVRIGRDRILYGNPPFEDYEFRYAVEHRGPYTWLKLESKFMRLELFKLQSEIGDVRASSVEAPLKSYPPEQLAELKRRYANLLSKVAN